MKKKYIKPETKVHYKIGEKCPIYLSNTAMSGIIEGLISVLYKPNRYEIN